MVTAGSPPTPRRWAFSSLLAGSKHAPPESRPLIGCQPPMAEVIRSSKALHVAADSLTCCNLASGIVAIFLPEEGPPVRRSALLLFGALCDSVDGTFARRSGNPTARGATADHIADFISFGIAP